MNSREYWGLMEAYAEVYAPQEIDEASAQSGRVTGSTQTIFKPTPTSPGSRRGAAPVPSSSSTGSVTSQRGRVTGSSSNNVFSQASRSGGTRRGAAAGVRGTSTTTAPTPASRPAAPAPTARPAAPAPTARPAPAPKASPAPAPKASPAPTTSSASTTAAAPKRTFNPLMQKTFGYQTGYAPDQVKKDPKKMAQMGSLKSVTSGFDMFDLVKGHLLDEGYADTEEAAIAIMANMSEEWRESIISEAPGEWFGGLRDKARASRASQIQASKPTPKPGPNVSSPFAKPASRNDSGKLTTYGAGGGAAAERSGKTRSQVMQQGAKNIETKNKSNPGPNFGR